MYSNEIQELLKIRNNLVTIKEYIEICSSPQIDYIKYDYDRFYLCTTDNYKFELKIKEDKQCKEKISN